MSRPPRKFPSKDRLRQMTVVELDDYIGGLHAELLWRQMGPLLDALNMRIAVALKVRDMRAGDEAGP